jgi:hypothetical protein
VDACTGGAIFSQSSSGGSDLALFDDNFTDVCFHVAQAGLPQRVGYKFATAKTITVIGITAVETPNHPGGSNCIRSRKVERIVLRHRVFNQRRNWLDKSANPLFQRQRRNHRTCQHARAVVFICT